jgi:hypothetical protein
LPSLIGLIALHGGLRGGVPLARGLAFHVVLADEGSLDFAGAGGVDGLLAALFLCG